MASTGLRLLSGLLTLLSVAGATSYRPPQDAGVERALLTLTDGARIGAGLEALTADETLAQAARQHAAEMADLGYFSHTSPLSEYTTLALRVRSERHTLVGGADTAQASVSG